MEETEKNNLAEYCKNCNNYIELFKKLTDFSSDIETKSDNEYQCDVFYDNTIKDDTDSVLSDEELFKYFDSNNSKSPSKL